MKISNRNHLIKQNSHLMKLKNGLIPLTPNMKAEVRKKKFKSI